MTRHAGRYGIKIKEDDEAKPKFVFYGAEGEVVEEMLLANMNEQQMHEELQARGFRFLSEQ